MNVINKESVKEALLKNIDDYFKSNQGEMSYVRSQVMPVVRKVVEDKVAALKLRAKNAGPWCKIRDGYLLPAFANISLFLMSFLVEYLVYATFMRLKHG
jgi:hypothetical protein